MRNSSLIKRSCAENVTGLKSDTEAVDRKMVGEHSVLAEAVPEGAVDGTEERMPV